MSESAVRKVVGKYFEGNKTGDLEKLRSIFQNDALMTGYLNGKFYSGDTSLFFDYMEEHGAMGDGYAGEITSLEVFGSIANVAVKESGLVGDLSFVDLFHLVKHDGEWTIFSKTYTTV